MRLLSDDALAAMIVWTEARGESDAAQVGVAEVIRNRVARRWQGATCLAEVVFQRRQFSAMNDEDPTRWRCFVLDDTDPVVQRCQRAVAVAATGTRTVEDAVFFLNVALTKRQRGGSLPPWFDPTRIVAELGRLTFLCA